MNLTILTNTSTKKEKLEKGSLLYVNSNGFSLSEKATNQLEIADGDRVIIAKDEESGAFFIGKGTETLGAKAKVKTAKAVFSSSAAHVELGGEKGKKYMIKNLKELLLKIAHLPMLEQEQKLAEEFDKWKGSNEQVDDVCIMGVRI